MILIGRLPVLKLERPRNMLYIYGWLKIIVFTKTSHTLPGFGLNVGRSQLTQPEKQAANFLNGSG